MAFETIGNYQLHLFAYERSQAGKWDPFVTIFRFDDAAQDFRCVMDKHQASELGFDSYEAAIEEARRFGSHLIQSGQADAMPAEGTCWPMRPREEHGRVPSGAGGSRGVH